MKKHIIDVPEIEKIGVYAIYNSKTEKYYVGSSINIFIRMKQHRSAIEKMNHTNKKIMEDLKTEDDIKNFSFLVLETFENLEITDKQLREKELYYYNLYHAYDGYNSKQHKPVYTGRFLDDGLLICQPGFLNCKLGNIKIYPSRQILDTMDKLKRVKNPGGLYWECKNEILRRLEYYDNNH